MRLSVAGRCRSRLDMVGELWIAKIERVERDDMENNTDGTFIIPVIPATEEAALVAVSERGWVQETIHGKELLLCPSCKNK